MRPLASCRSRHASCCSSNHRFDAASRRYGDELERHVDRQHDGEQRSADGEAAEAARRGEQQCDEREALENEIDEVDGVQEGDLVASHLTELLAQLGALAEGRVLYSGHGDGGARAVATGGVEGERASVQYKEPDS